MKRISVKVVTLVIVFWVVMMSYSLAGGLPQSFSFTIKPASFINPVTDMVYQDCFNRVVDYLTSQGCAASDDDQTADVNITLSYGEIKPISHDLDYSVPVENALIDSLDFHAAFQVYNRDIILEIKDYISRLKYTVTITVQYSDGDLQYACPLKIHYSKSEFLPSRWEWPEQWNVDTDWLK